jgi:long-subunit fatty acid transport protein
MVDSEIRPARRVSFCVAAVCLLLAAYGEVRAQGSATLGNGLTAAAIARGGINAAQRDSPLDAMQGNPAGLAQTSARSLDLSAVGVVVGGSFQNALNPDAHPTGVAGALPFAAVALPIRQSPWVAAAAVTPEILMRANWHYLDTPGTAGVTYGNQLQEDQIIAIRSALGIARSFSPRWSAGASLGIVYNANNLNAPYIFQQQPQLAGLKVLLSLGTHGYGWNGGAGVQFQPSPRLHLGLAWKSGTTLRTRGIATGSASALFTALGISANPAFGYNAQVENHLPQAFDAAVSWQAPHHLAIAFQTDFTAWGQAFQQLPITLTNGSNPTINSVVGSSTLHDAVPLHWNNQGTYRAGFEHPLGESWTLRGGFSWANNPVPSATLIPLTAAIMRSAIATGAGYSRGRWRLDAAYQAQLPSTQSVSQSSLQAGEYNNSRIRIFTQSLTLTARTTF